MAAAFQFEEHLCQDTESDDIVATWFVEYSSQDVGRLYSDMGHAMSDKSVVWRFAREFKTLLLWSGIRIVLLAQMPPRLATEEIKI